MLELPRLIDLTGADRGKRGILELGAGISGILPVILGNFGRHLRVDRSEGYP